MAQARHIVVCVCVLVVMCCLLCVVVVIACVIDDNHTVDSVFAFDVAGTLL